MSIMTLFTNEYNEYYNYYSLNEETSTSVRHIIYDIKGDFPYHIHKIGEKLFLDIRLIKLSTRVLYNKKFKEYLYTILSSEQRRDPTYLDYELPKEFSFSIYDIRIYNKDLKSIDIEENDKNCFIIHFYEEERERFNSLLSKGKNMTKYLKKFYSFSRVIIKLSKKE